MLDEIEDTFNITNLSSINIQSTLQLDDFFSLTLDEFRIADDSSSDENNEEDETIHVNHFVENNTSRPRG